MEKQIGKENIVESMNKIGITDCPTSLVRLFMGEEIEISAKKNSFKEFTSFLKSFKSFLKKHPQLSHIFAELNDALNLKIGGYNNGRYKVFHLFFDNGWNYLRLFKSREYGFGDLSHICEAEALRVKVKEGRLVFPDMKVNVSTIRVDNSQQILELLREAVSIPN